MASYEKMTGKTIGEAFAEFHAENPAVYQMFKKYFFELYTSGARKTSAKLITERVRWESMIKTNGEPYKINNNFTSYYARLFIKDFSSFKDCFETRCRV